MKTKVYIFSLMVTVILLASCNGIQETPSNHYVDETKIPVAVKSSFTQNYPQVPQAAWEIEHNNYVVEFEINGHDVEVWYDVQGNFIRSETDIPYSELPAEVKTAHSASAYASWYVDDVDKVEWHSRETEYILDLENGALERTVTYLLSELGVTPGTLVDNDLPGDDDYFDNDSDYDVPQYNVPQVVLDAFVAQYPQAGGAEWEQDNGHYDVEFIWNNNEAEARYTSVGTWIRTVTEMNYFGLPAAVKTSFTASVYASWRVDDVVMIEKNTEATTYILDVESGNLELKLCYTVDGVLQNNPGGGGGNENPGGGGNENPGGGGNENPGGGGNENPGGGGNENPGGGGNENPGGGGGNGNPGGNNLGNTPQVVKDAFNAQYPGATQIEWEADNGLWEVEFVLGGFEAEAYYATDGSWRRTETEMNYRALPQVVKDAFAASVYAGWEVEDVTCIECANQPTRYVLEVERGDNEVEWTYTVA